MKKETPQLPRRIKVNHLVWKVVALSEAHADQLGCYGYCLPGVLTIQVKENLTPRLAADTLLHECVHAMVFSSGIPTECFNEEGMASWLPGALADLFNNNPGLAEWWNAMRLA